RDTFVRDWRVSRSHKDGVTKGPGFLDDYSAIALAWLDVYSLTGDRRWLDDARALGDSARTWFWEEDTGAWYDTARDHERLITRPRDVTDNAVPSGTSLATELMLRLAVLTGDESYRSLADRVLASLGGVLTQHPTAFGHLLGAADFAVFGAVELAVIGPPQAQTVAEMLRHVANRYLPSLMLVQSEGSPESDLPLLQGRPRTEHAVAYVCRQYACEAPARSVADLAASLDSALRAGAASVR
ncbi:MAG: thioredoxin domain-containing protein, partial [Gemmatimonadaceae bacterium]